MRSSSDEARPLVHQTGQVEGGRLLPPVHPEVRSSLPVVVVTMVTSREESWRAGGRSSLHASCPSYGSLPGPQASTSCPSMTRRPPELLTTSFGPVLVEEVHTSTGSVMYLGIFLAIISGLLFTCSNFFVQYFVLNPAEALGVRSLLQIVLVGGYTAATCRAPCPGPPSALACLVVQGVMAGLRVGLSYSSMAFLPIGDAITIIFTEPIWTLLLSRVIFGTKISLRMVASCILLMVGAVVVVQPPGLFPPPEAEVTIHPGQPAPSALVGAALALAASVAGAGQNVLISGLVEVPPCVLLLHSGIGGLACTLGMALLDPSDRLGPAEVASIPLSELLLLLCLGVIGLLGFASLTKALQVIPPTTVAVLRSLEVVMAFAMQAVVLGLPPTILDLVGGAVVVGGVVLGA